MADPWIPAATARNLADHKRDFHDHKLFSAADNYACNFLFDRGNTGLLEQRRPLIRQTLFSVPTMETGYSPRSNFPYFCPTFWGKYFFDKFISVSPPPLVGGV